MAMRSYQQVRDVLKQVSRYHQELLEYAETVDASERDEPLRPLVDYLAAHERGVKSILDGYAPTEREAVLDTWLQYVPDHDVDAVFKKRDFRDARSVDDVLAMMMEFDDALVDLYKSLADNAQTPPRVNAVFRNLLDMQDWQRHRNGWSIRESSSFARGDA